MEVAFFFQDKFADAAAGVAAVLHHGFFHFVQQIHTKNLGALAWQWAKGIASPIVGAINANPAQGVILVDEKK